MMDPDGLNVAACHLKPDTNDHIVRLQGAKEKWNMDLMNLYFGMTVVYVKRIVVANHENIYMVHT